jgi:DNA-binding MarR family transcriptional regulator
MLPVPAARKSGYGASMDTDARTITEMFETISLGAPENAVGFVMWRVVHRYIRTVDQALRPLDLTHLQFVTLTLVAWMARTGDEATQSEVARFGAIHPMQVSTLLKALEQKRMVRRTPSPDNALAKRVAVTSTGLTALHAALPLVIEAQAKLFGDAGRPGGRLLQALVSIDREA